MTTLEERFWAKVDRRDPGECWRWTGATSGNGYGYIRVQGRPVKATRVAMQLDGRDPGTVARHTCDNPICCNPAHLISGTQADNIRDMIDRGRSARPGAKLTADAVAEIRALLAAGGPTTQREVAAAFGVRQTAISYIATGRSWA